MSQDIYACKCKSPACMCPHKWTHMLDVVYGEDWEARRRFVELYLHRDWSGHAAG